MLDGSTYVAPTMEHVYYTAVPISAPSGVTTAITGVSAGAGLAGGGTSGVVTLADNRFFPIATAGIGGTRNDYELTTGRNITGLEDGMLFLFFTDHGDNTGAMTIDVDGLGPLPFRRSDGAGALTELEAGEAPDSTAIMALYLAGYSAFSMLTPIQGTAAKRNVGTAAGELAALDSAGAIPLAQGGTGATTLAAAQAALGIGTVAGFTLVQLATAATFASGTSTLTLTVGTLADSLGDEVIFTRPSNVLGALTVNVVITDGTDSTTAYQLHDITDTQVTANALNQLDSSTLRVRRSGADRWTLLGETVGAAKLSGATFFGAAGGLDPTADAHFMTQRVDARRVHEYVAESISWRSSDRTIVCAVPNVTVRVSDSLILNVPGGRGLDSTNVYMEVNGDRELLLPYENRLGRVAARELHPGSILFAFLTTFGWRLLEPHLIQRAGDWNTTTI